MDNRERLRAVIDRMVEDAIRRILPGVMNEVLVATLARAHVTPITESAPRRRNVKKKVPRKVREQVAPSRARAPKAARGRPSSLDQLLDESVGADFYQDPRLVVHDAPVEDHESTPRLAARAAALPAELRELAEGIDLDDDGGEMWQPDEHDSAGATAVISEIRDIGGAVASAGLDMARMKSLIGATSPRPVRDRDASQANVQFEQGRINRMRARLDGNRIG